MIKLLMAALLVTSVAGCRNDKDAPASNKKIIGSAGGAKTSEASLKDSLSGIGLVFERFQSKPVESDVAAQAIADLHKIGKIVARESAPIAYKRFDAIVAAVHSTIVGLGADKLPKTPPTVYIVNNKEPNAVLISDLEDFIPHWAIFVYSGLLLPNDAFEFKSDADLAWLFGHELGHALQMHSLRESKFQGDEPRLRDHIDASLAGKVVPLKASQTSAFHFHFARAALTTTSCELPDSTKSEVKSWLGLWASRPAALQEHDGENYFSDADAVTALRTEFSAKAKPLFEKLNKCNVPLIGVIYKLYIESLSLVRAQRLAPLIEGKTTFTVTDVDELEKALVDIAGEIKASPDLHTTEREADEVAAVLSHHLGLKASSTLLRCKPDMSLVLDDLPKRLALVPYKNGDAYVRLEVSAHPDNCYRAALYSNIQRDLAALAASGKYPRIDSVKSALIEQSGGKSVVPPGDWNTMIEELKKLQL